MERDRGDHQIHDRQACGCGTDAAALAPDRGADEALPLVEVLEMTVDPKVHELAAHFLRDVEGATGEDELVLAVEIQATIEDFIEHEVRAEFEKSKQAEMEKPV
jgi:hypothetical protein